jgi:hypothetical protein
MEMVTETALPLAAVGMATASVTRSVEVAVDAENETGVVHSREVKSK